MDVAGQRIAVSPHARAETIETDGCSVRLRRMQGPEAQELFFLCRPVGEARNPSEQAEAVYRAIVDLLESEGGSFSSVASETLFLRSVDTDLERIRTARQRVLATRDASAHRPATTEIEQPPLDERACLEVSVQAVLPNGSPWSAEAVEAAPACGCAHCAGSHGLRFESGPESRLQAGGLCGPGESAFDQAFGMFGLAERLLERAGMAFGDVVRTWIHLRDIDRDYADLNRARRAFFEARGIDPPPASTGIGGAPVSAAHDLCLGVYAVKAETPLVRIPMQTPTLNEAMQYGADFVRGMRVAEANKVALHVSGTASIDEAGRTAHSGDFEAQVDRMLVNIAALLDGQGASFGEVVSAVTYLKRPTDARRLREKLREAGFEDFPHALVKAPICRPELLCETEALAVLPVASTNAARRG